MSSDGPTFIIVGAARSGTTSLYHWLKLHPQVFMSSVKETNFFAQLKPNFTGPGDQEINRPLATCKDPDGSYRTRHAVVVTSWDDYVSLFSKAAGFAARGEASPAYLYYTDAAENIRRTIPGCKIIILLRNPVERAFSNYKVLLGGGRESLAFEAALRMEDQRLRLGWEHFWALKGLGLYSAQVKRYLDTFPKEQIGIWLYEDLEHDQEQCFREVCQFISVDDRVELNFAKYNMSTSKQVESNIDLFRRYPKSMRIINTWVPARFRTLARAILKNSQQATPIVMRPATRIELTEYFRPDIMKLQKLLPEHNVMRWLTEQTSLHRSAA